MRVLLLGLLLSGCAVKHPPITPLPSPVYVPVADYSKQANLVCLEVLQATYNAYQDYLYYTKRLRKATEALALAKQLREEDPHAYESALQLYNVTKRELGAHKRWTLSLNSNACDAELKK